MNASAKHSPTEGSGNIDEEGTERFLESENHRVCCEIVASKSVRSCSLKVSPTCLTQCGLNKDVTNRHAIWMG